MLVLSSAHACRMVNVRHSHECMDMQYGKDDVRFDYGHTLKLCGYWHLRAKTAGQVSNDSYLRCPRFNVDDECHKRCNHSVLVHGSLNNIARAII